MAKPIPLPIEISKLEPDAYNLQVTVLEEKIVAFLQAAQQPVDLTTVITKMKKQDPLHELYLREALLHLFNSQQVSCALNRQLSLKICPPRSADPAFAPENNS